MLELLAQPSLTVLPTTLSGTEVELSIFGLTVLIAAIMPWLARTFSKINSSVDTSNSGEANGTSRREFAARTGLAIAALFTLQLPRWFKSEATPVYACQGCAIPRDCQCTKVWTFDLYSRCNLDCPIGAPPGCTSAFYQKDYLQCANYPQFISCGFLIHYLGRIGCN